ncbi:MAG: NAD(P)/FAD-dependent oxidoreductase [Anaerolineales bacterium]|nr:NAD(P)/FAD-dependent oxidoreductase [Chloroflexota bacterium]MBL6980881.1 NAD(P)/FAD-dependent oxidoreductase [Anaerolineales bacterium]
METRQIIVIGGGAAGLMAAGQAAQLGARVTLLEKMDSPGRKLFISGKGRCNITNVAPINEFIEHFGRNGRFLRQAFHRYFSEDLLAFFHEHSVPTITERGGRVFPASGLSSDVVNALVNWATYEGVKIWTQSPVEEILLEDGRVIGVKTEHTQLDADAVIIATGGASYPGTGSTGDGYQFAQRVGHSIIPIRPALVPLVTARSLAKELQGLSLRNVAVTVWTNGKKSDSAFGEMLFTHFGVSGPIILTLSRDIVDSLRSGKKVALSIDLKPALDEVKLDARLLRDLKEFSNKQFKTILKELLPNSLIPVCTKLTGIPEGKVGHQISADERKRLRSWLKNFRLEISAHRKFNQAIVTAGGVDTREIDPKTMQSRLVEGLYFAGEVLDVDADTGGYNLQAAFSTGWLAGRSAANQNKNQR